MTMRASIIPYQLPVAEVLAAPDVQAQSGLRRAEAQSRLQKYGRNELTAERPDPEWRKFLAQFDDVLVILLLIATAISSVLWLYERESALPYEAVAIFAIMLFNAIMGFIFKCACDLDFMGFLRGDVNKIGNLSAMIQARMSLDGTFGLTKPGPRKHRQA